MSKKNYYAVVKGRQPGIYTNWSGDEGAEAQIKGFPGPLYKGFATHAEAEKWLRDMSKGLAPLSKSATIPVSNPTKGSVDGVRHVAVQPLVEAGMLFSQPANDDRLPRHSGNDTLVIYTDGACLGNPGPGGYGVVLLHQDGRQELSGGYRLTTNNRMELTACIKALESLGASPSNVVLYTDSQYVANGMNKGWAKSWRAHGWNKSRGGKAENADLWARLLDLCGTHTVEIVWIRGHVGTDGNERCDELSVKAASARNLPEDTGYHPKPG